MVATSLDNSFSVLDRDLTSGGGFVRHNRKSSIPRNIYGKLSFLTFTNYSFLFNRICLDDRNSRSGVQYDSRDYSSARNVTLAPTMQSSSSQRSTASKSMETMPYQRDPTIRLESVILKLMLHLDR